MGFFMRDSDHIGMNLHFIDLGSLGKSAELMADMDAHLLLYIFLPPLIFESSYNINESSFAKVSVAALSYAGPGLLIATGVTGFVLHLFYPSWNVYQCGLLGALLSGELFLILTRCNVV